MRNFALATLLLGLASCTAVVNFDPPNPSGVPDAAVDAALPVIMADAADSQPSDAATPRDAALDATEDAKRVTYTGSVQAIIAEKCGNCHREPIAYNGGAPPFAAVDGYAYLVQSSTRCLGTSVGGCVALVMQEQNSVPVTFVPDSGMGPFCMRGGGSGPVHREAFWTCGSPSEVATVVEWVRAGLPER
jgi:hypothetical protein